MPNVINADGLTTNTQAELIAQYTAAFKAIYGADINLDQDSPDGQMMMIFIQSVLDVQDLLTQIYNQFDPDNAIGVVLDQRVAINGIQRQAGTFTVTPVTISIDRSLNLYGLDQNVFPVFTVADDAGNQWQLITSVNEPDAGDYILQFQSSIPGAVLTVPNTITVPVTIVIGVTAINNPTTYSTLGINEESDAVLKVRRQRSTALSSQGYLAGLLAALENINGVTGAFVYENNTASTDGDLIPSHSIWVIVDGSGAAASIANAIYTKRNAGCGMKGDVSFIITQADGSSFEIKWDIVTSENLFIKFTATSLDGVNPPNIAAIRSGLVLSLVPGVAAQVNINELSTLVQQIDPNTLVTSAGFSTTSGGSYTNTLTPSTKDKRFVVTEANIIIIPMIMSPVSAAVGSAETVDFSTIGGYGTYTYSMHTSSSGSPSVNASTGVYVAGAGTGTDVVRVTDSLGNIKDANVVVT